MDQVQSNNGAPLPPSAGAGSAHPPRDTDRLYHLAASSRASRIVKLKGNNRKSVVGACVSHLDGKWQTLVFESRHELMTAKLLLAMPGLENLYDQPPRVAYIGADGQRHHHTFDFLAVIKGRRYAVACKFSSTAERIRFREQLGLIRQQWEDFADEIILVTEKDFGRPRALHAELYHFMRHDDDAEADDAVFALTRKLVGKTTIGSIVQASGLKARAFRAIVRLIGRRDLEIVGSGRVDDYETLIARTVTS